MNAPPLIVHLVFRLDFGGLENMLIERINRMPAERYRHAVVSLTYHTDFAKKINKPGVDLYDLHKPAGLALATHARLWKLLRQLKPAVVHTYNLSAVEYGVTAMMASVPVRVSGSHGRDASDPEGRNRKHNFLRRMTIPFYDCCYSNSADLERWNRTVIGVPERKSRLLHNGIDTSKYKPGPAPESAPFPPGSFVIGTVGRIQDVKDHPSLIDAFLLLKDMVPAHWPALRLAIVGDGPMMATVREKVSASGIVDKVWMPGARTDVNEVLRSFSLFALSSIAEGTPGSALEAMATGLPVVGTRVGGIPEVVADGLTGFVVPARDPHALATAIARYIEQPDLAATHGRAGLERVMQKYSMSAMLNAYLDMYDSLCHTKIKIREPRKSCVE